MSAAVETRALVAFALAFFGLVSPTPAHAVWFPCVDMSRTVLWIFSRASKARHPLEYVERADWADHVVAMKRVLARKDAVDVSEKLQKALDSILFSFREKLDALDLSRSADIARFDELFAEIDAKLAALELTGTGYVMKTAEPISLVTADADVLARHAKLRPGVVQFPSYVLFSGRDIVAMRTQRDSTPRSFYVDEMMLRFEELYHLVQYLRLYGGLRGRHANLSHWARSLDADFTVDIEPDVYAYLLERWGLLGPRWRARYPREGRNQVPTERPRVSEPGLLLPI